MAEATKDVQQVQESEKYCNFHRDNRHLTEECTHLKDNIEDLIRRGCLTKFKANISYNITYENRDSDNRGDDRRLGHRQSQLAD